MFRNLIPKSKEVASPCPKRVFSLYLLRTGTIGVNRAMGCLHPRLKYGTVQRHQPQLSGVVKPTFTMMPREEPKPLVTSTFHTPPWLLSGWEYQGQRPSRGQRNPGRLFWLSRSL